VSEITDCLENSGKYLDYMSSDRIPFPKSLQIELTSYCNLECVMCPRTLGAHRSEPNKHMEPEILEYIISSILPYVQRVDVVGDGEPLTAPELLFDLLENADFFKIPVTICTNGILLDEKMSERLIDSNLHDMNISIDAAEPETYARIRGADFDQLLDNIRTFSRLKKEAGKDTPHLHFSMVAMKDNIEELQSLVNLARDLGVESVTVQAMGEEDDSVKGQSAFLHHRDLAEEVIYMSLIESEAMNFPLKLWPDQLMDVMASNEELGPFLTGEAPPPGESENFRKNCSFLWETPFITTNGDVRPCCANLPPVGNLKDKSFHDIWYSPEYANLRRRLLKNELDDACLKCPGMSWRNVTPPKSNLVATDTAFDLFPGWYSPELEERYYRWSREKAALFLKRKKSDLFCLVQMRKAGLENAPESGNILIDSDITFPFELKTTIWETMEIPLPNAVEDDLTKIEINLSHSVRPSELDDSSTDSRDIGIKLSRIWFESWPKKVVFGNQLLLLGYEITPESWATGGDAIVTTYWRTLDKTHVDMKLFLHLTREKDSGSASTPLKRKLGMTRKDFFQADQLLQANGQASSMWIPGMFVAQEHRISIPEEINPGHYRLEIGLYPEGAPKDRLSIARSDRPTKDDQALLGTILVSEQ